MPVNREDPKIAEAVGFLPADGSPMKYDAWIAAMRNAGRFDLVRLSHKVRRSGKALYNISDVSDPSGSHEIRRAPAVG